MDAGIQDMGFIDALEERAAASPDAVAVAFVDGPEWAWAELVDKARTCAANLAKLDVKRGDAVVCWLPSGPLSVLAFYSLAHLGAVFVPVSTAFRGRQLQHVLENSGARIMLADADLLKHLRPGETGAIAKIIADGSEIAALDGIAIQPTSLLDQPCDMVSAPFVRPDDWETQLVIYTSGTTGPSKGVCCSYRHLRTASHASRNIRHGDRALSMLPMSHLSGIFCLVWSIYHDGSAVIAERFRTEAFWPTIRRYNVTTTALLGAMADFLNDAPVLDADHDNPLQTIVIVPYGPAARLFADRFGVEVYTLYGMTELSVPLFAGPTPEVIGTCGTPSPGMQLRLADEHDEPVPDGEPGELLIRPDRPWTISHGYLNDPAADGRAWRNGWFHTGDILRQDAAGHYHFVDRRKDCIRRRGENISSFDVECALMEHPQIVEAAVVAVDAPESSEEEVLAVVRLIEGRSVEDLDLPNFLRSRLAAFAVPRFVRTVDAFPRTATHKISKVQLRDEGIDARTLDFGYSHTRK